MADENKIATKEEMWAAIVNPEYTGNEVSTSKKFPPVINILQSDKQYAAFEGVKVANDAIYADGISDEQKQAARAKYSELVAPLVSSLGMLFVRRDINTAKDLVDSVKGTVLKMEQGYEVLEGEGAEAKVIASGTPMITGDANKAMWRDNNPGKSFRNMVKIVLAPVGVDPKTIVEQYNNGDMPLIMLTIKGAGWGDWFNTQKQMNSVAMASTAYGNRKANQLLVSAFNFTVRSKKQRSDAGFDFYSPVVEVGLNDPEVAFAFSGLVLAMKDFSLFYKVAESIEGEQSAADKQLPFSEEPGLSADVVEGVLD